MSLAEEAFRRLPDAFRRLAGDVVFHVQDFADEATLAEMGIEDPFELTGLYHGVDRLHQSVMDLQPTIPRVFLYRRPILDEWAEHADLPLGELVEHILVHEVGHHFGLTDPQIEAIEAQD